MNCPEITHLACGADEFLRATQQEGAWLGASDVGDTGGIPLHVILENVLGGSVKPRNQVLHRGFVEWTMQLDVVVVFHTVTGSSQ
jgi:hypothetical protein